MTQPPASDRVAAIIREVGATIVVPHFRSLDSSQVRQKNGPEDLVTVADEAAERALSARLTDLVPGSLVVGEEEVSADPALMRRLEEDAPVWVIDPIDGTFNFASGNPGFGIIVAYVRNGRTLAGWIHDPVRDRMAEARAGEGVAIDGVAVRLQSPATIGEAMGAVSRRYCSEALRDQLEARAAGLRVGVPTVCSAQEYLRILSGDAHFGLYHRIYPWDHAAGSLMLNEAGGHSAYVDGTPYGPMPRPGSLLVASSPETWAMIRAYLLG